MADVNYNKFGQPADGAAGADAAAGATTGSDIDAKLELITRNLDEVCKREIMENILRKEGRDLRIYWGTATTGRPHVAYFVPLSKIADFLRAGCEVTILFADIHGYLDNMKSTFELLKLRTEYYKQVICAALESIGVSLAKLKFVTGSSYQLTPEFTLDILKLTTLCSQHDAQKAGAEVVKQTSSPPLSGLLYPIYQWLDEEYLGVDAQFGGVDQRKIFISAEKYLPKIGYRARSHLMNPMVPGLTGEKMSSSEVDSKIDLIDTPKAVQKKINKVFCEQGNIEKNPLLAFVKAVILLVHGEFVLQVYESDPITYTDYAQLEKDFADSKIHPGDLKKSVISHLNKLLDPIRAKFEKPEMQELISAAYPDGSKKKGGATGGKQKNKGGKAADAGPVNDAIDVSRVALTVGRIVTAKMHPDADSLYIEDVETGEEKNRTVISGLAGKVPLEEMQNRMVVLCTNLKPSKMRGILSEAMVMCASEDGKVEPIMPPEGSVPGDVITVEGFTGPDKPADKVLNPKKKIFEKVAPDFLTNDEGVATYKGVPWVVEGKGVCKAATMKNSHIK